MRILSLCPQRSSPSQCVQILPNSFVYAFVGFILMPTWALALMLVPTTACLRHMIRQYVLPWFSRLSDRLQFL